MEEAGRQREFNVVRRIAVGPRCDIVSANDEQGRLVVLKRLRARKERDASTSLFEEVASRYAGLRHPNVARVLDWFSTEDQHVIVIEHVDGITLARMLKKLESRLDASAAACVAAQIFAALAAAHEVDLVHGHVCPANVILSWDGEVKVMDFGMWRVARDAGASRPSITSVPKDWYFAPERVTSGGEPMTGGDVYSAALVAWELFAGRSAFASRTDAEVIEAATQGLLESLDVARPEMDAAAREIVHLALEPDVGARIGRATTVQRVLEGAAGGARGRALLVMALESIRPAPESRPSRDVESIKPETTDAGVYKKIALRPSMRPSADAPPASAPRIDTVFTDRRSTRRASTAPPPDLGPSPAPLPAPAALPPAPRPARARSGLVALGCAVVAGALGVVLGRSLLTKPAQAPPVAVAATTAAPAIATSTAPSPPPPSPSKAPPPPPAATHAELVVVKPPGHRVFVDGRVVGESPGTFRVSCGKHTVKVGSAGASQTVALTCGSSLELQ